MVTLYNLCLPSERHDVIQLAQEVVGCMLNIKKLAKTFWTYSK